MVIKQASKNDIDDIFNIEHQVFGEETRASLERSLAVDCFEYYLAVDCEKIVGYVAVSFVGDDVEILSIAVAQNNRRKGIGRALLNFAIDQAQKRGKNKVFLEVRAGNINAHNLYKSLGFNQIYVRKNYYSAGKGQGEDALIFQKDLV